jgi:glucose-6-phosphate 1-dehydrogenase
MEGKESNMLRDIRRCNTQFVLFGASGDLSRRLVVPALFNLHLDGQLPQSFTLWGLGQKEWQAADLAAHLRQGVAEHSRRGPPPDDAWRAFAANIRYVRADLTDDASFVHLKETLDAEGSDATERVFYLAVPPSLFRQVARGLGKAGLNEARATSRVVVEKPLGHDLDSFRAINKTLADVFLEPQIFRIDHFLGKETVQNILAMRFANPIFEPIWNRRYIDHVAITVAETLGVEHRARYYEHAGALRDMVQNHLMQILCLIAMEPPTSYDADDIRGKKMDVLHALRPIDRDNVHEYAARGQYGGGWINSVKNVAYREEADIDAHSNVETFAAVKLLVDNWRWQGVPFYLRTGKRMAAEVSEVSIRFRDVPHRAFPNNAGLDTQPVRLVIQMNPQEGIVLKFMVKEPGAHWRLRPVDMRFSYGEAFQRPSPAAYETLIRDIILGDATLFMRADQVEAAWKLLQPILDVWEENPAPDFPNYASGSWGPEAAEALIARDGRNWMTPTLIPTEDKK